MSEKQKNVRKGSIAQRVYNQETTCLCKRFLVKNFMPGPLSHLVHPLAL